MLDSGSFGARFFYVDGTARRFASWELALFAGFLQKVRIYSTFCKKLALCAIGLYHASMKKQIIVGNLNELRTQLVRTIGVLSKSAYLKIDGSMIVSGTRVYFHDKVKGTRRYLGKDDDNLIGGLSGKMYAQKLLAAAKKELSQVESCLRALNSGRGISDIEDVYGALAEAVKKRVEPLNITSDDYVRRWLEYYRSVRNQSVAMDSPNTTMNGEKVKSKSEVIIADRLRAAGVPYVYETAVSFDGGNTLHYPDFTILNQRTLQVFYWEHCGKMEDPKYVYDFNLKLSKYTRNNIFPGKSLLLSFEGKNSSLQMSYVDSLIKEYLV